MNIVIPMAGRGSRFADKYVDPKPFIKINDKFMVINVVENIDIQGAKYIFIVQKEHMKIYGSEFVKQIRNTFVKDFEIIELDEITEGAACTLLKAASFIDNTDELLVVNSDQLCSPSDIQNSVKYFEKNNYDGGVITFFNRSQKWSYCQVDDNRLITRIAEKQPISEHASVGVYWWKEGGDFVESANSMILKNERFNNEFYVAPTYNYLIIGGKRIAPYFINEMFALGTPQDFEKYLEG